MDSNEFDRLALSVTTGMTRSRLLKSLLGGAAAAVAGTTLHGSTDVEAKKKKKKKKKVSTGKQQLGLNAAPKCWICHVPPGNPDNAHALNVGCPAVGPEGHSNHEGDCVDGETNCHIPVKEHNAFCWKGTCTPEKNPCGDRECGTVKDRCGNDVPCGTCESGDCEDGHCSVCTPNCLDGEKNTCGDDGCGGTCVCPDGNTCGTYSKICIPVYLS